MSDLKAMLNKNRLDSQGARRNGTLVKLMRLGVSAFLVLVSLLTLARLSVFTGTWWAELFAYLPYPLLVIPAGLVCVVSWFLGKAYRVAAVTSLLLVLSVLMGLSVGYADSGTGRVRLMTYNVKSYLAVKNRGYLPLVLEIMKHDPDIVVMQDAGQLIAQRKASPGSIQAIYEGRQEFSFGQYLVLSRFPLRDCRHDMISYRNESHSFVRCVVSAHGQDLDLITAHFKTPRDGLNAARHEKLAGLDEWQSNFDDRMQQASTLSKFVAERKRPVIVAGDLNAPEFSIVIRKLLSTGLRDAWSSAEWGYGYSHGHSFRPHVSFLRIDHILVSREIGVVSCEVGGKDASDHRPVIADLVLNRSR